MDNKIFYVLAAGFTAGIFLSSFFKMGFSFFLFLLILSSIIFTYGKFITKFNKAGILLLALFIFSFSLGILRYEIKEVSTVSALQNQIGEKVNLTGLVIDEPAVKDKTTQLTVQVGSEKVLVSTGLFPEFKYGDMVQVEGKLEQPENFETDTGNEFDYIGYLAKDDIFYQVSFAQV